jgi:deazaflavin-dependent oxidoreductase (nitroreductase family)
MTNEQTLEFNRAVIADFREHGGVMPEGSMFHGNPTLLMTMTGAKSGRSLTSPLTYASDDDGWVIMASAGGSEQTPAWAFNLRANPTVTIELLDETFDAVATEAEGPERDRVFDLMTGQLPRFADYQKNVERQIPLFRLTRA